MADFKTHITTSTVIGVGYGLGGFFGFGFSLEHSMVAGALCSVAGMLPDLDSSSGIPQRETLSFLAVLVPMLMLHRFRQWGMSPENMVFAAGVIYVVFRFGLGRLFSKYTKHRGMWHSIPAAMIAGLTTFIVCLSPELSVRLFKSWAVVLGFVTHLVLDEIWSVDWNGHEIRVKKSFGTALKWFSPKLWPNISTYGKLAILLIIVFGDHSLTPYFGEQPVDIIPHAARQWLMDSLGGDGPVIQR